MGSGSNHFVSVSLVFGFACEAPGTDSSFAAAAASGLDTLGKHRNDIKQNVL
jgi:hypothetical protein